MKKKVLEKLRSRRGDSIAEVLVAVLISAVALVMLASMITSSSRLITRSKDKMEEYYEKSSALADHGGTVSTGSVRLTTKDGGSTVTVKNWEVSYSENRSVTDPVNAYWVPAPAGG